MPTDTLAYLLTPWKQISLVAIHSQLLCLLFNSMELQYPSQTDTSPISSPLWLGTKLAALILKWKQVSISLRFETSCLLYCNVGINQGSLPISLWALEPFTLIDLYKIFSLYSSIDRTNKEHQLSVDCLFNGITKMVNALVCNCHQSHVMKRFTALFSVSWTSFQQPTKLANFSAKIHPPRSDKSTCKPLTKCDPNKTCKDDLHV